MNDRELERIQKYCESIEECNNTDPKTKLNVPLTTQEVRFLLELAVKAETYRTALERLDSYIDFSEPLDNGDWGIEDTSGINALFAEIKRILGTTHD